MYYVKKGLNRYFIHGNILRNTFCVDVLNGGNFATREFFIAATDMAFKGIFLPIRLAQRGIGLQRSVVFSESNGGRRLGRSPLCESNFPLACALICPRCTTIRNWKAPACYQGRLFLKEYPREEKGGKTNRGEKENIFVCTLLVDHVTS